MRQIYKYSKPWLQCRRLQRALKGDNAKCRQREGEVQLTRGPYTRMESCVNNCIISTVYKCSNSWHLVRSCQSCVTYWSLTYSSVFLHRCNMIFFEMQLHLLRKQDLLLPECQRRCSAQAFRLVACGLLALGLTLSLQNAFSVTVRNYCLSDVIRVLWNSLHIKSLLTLWVK